MLYALRQASSRLVLLYRYQHCDAVRHVTAVEESPSPHYAHINAAHVDAAFCIQIALIHSRGQEAQRAV